MENKFKEQKEEVKSFLYETYPLWLSGAKIRKVVGINYTTFNKIIIALIKEKSIKSLITSSCEVFSFNYELHIKRRINTKLLITFKPKSMDLNKFLRLIKEKVEKWVVWKKDTIRFILSILN